MSLRFSFLKKFVAANEELENLISKKQKGEYIDKKQFDNLMNDILAKDPPDPLVLKMVEKMSQLPESPSDVKDTVLFFKTKLNKDLQFITTGALSLMVIISNVTNDPKLNVQTYWLNLLQTINEEETENDKNTEDKTD